jgi:hypothetical protein
MSEQGFEVNPEDLMSIDGEYNVMMTYASGIIGELFNDRTPLSAKATRRRRELYDRMMNIQDAWRNNLKLSKPERKKEMKEVNSMTRELLDDMKNFENKKLSI